MLPDDPMGDDPLMDEMPGEDSHEDGKSFRGVIPDFVRKVAVAGLGAVFMTEEGIRNLAGQLKLPKEALTYVLGQAENTKDQIGRVLSEEIRRFLQSEKLRDEFLKALAGMTVEIKAEVKLIPDRVKGEAPSLLPKVHISELKTKYGGSKKKKGEE
ncbi:MAG: hypothetical protein H6Q89_4553 [Myxococcaceae bacterium]|nr:hypothetical protein [Myxococcaceae bacterium]